MSRIHNQLPDGTDPESDWLDAVAVGRLDAAAAAKCRRELSARPAELRRLEQELALNALLDACPRAPQASSNFAAQVAARIAAEDRQHRAAARQRPWWRVLGGNRPAWALAALAVSVLVGWQGMGRWRHSEMATAVEAVALTASAHGLPAESLEDYDAIRRLGTVPEVGDEALIAALAENSTP